MLLYVLCRLQSILLSYSWGKQINLTLDAFLSKMDFSKPLLNVFKRRVDFDKFHMALYYGYEEGRMQLGEFLQYLNATFTAVVVAELMEESLVLLRRTLCWQVGHLYYYAGHCW